MSDKRVFATDGGNGSFDLYLRQKKREAQESEEEMRGSVSAVIIPLGNRNKHSAVLLRHYYEAKAQTEEIPDSSEHPRALGKMRFRVKSSAKKSSKRVEKSFKEFYDYLRGIYRSCLEALDQDVGSLANELKKSDLPPRTYRRLEHTRHAVQDIRAKREAVPVLPYFPHFWTAVTRVHEEIKGLRVESGLYWEPTHLERYMGMTLNESWEDPERVFQRQRRLDIEHVE